MKKKIKYALISVVVIGILGFSYSYYEARSIQIRRYTYKHKDIPKEFSGFKLMFLSDIHCNNYFDQEDVRHLVQMINNNAPDAILIGGDMLDYDSAYIYPLCEELKNLQSSMGKYFILGNHDFWTSPKLINRELDKISIWSCNNQAYWLKRGSDSIRIGGVGDLWEDEQIIQNTIDDVHEDDFCILLSHNPNYIENLNTNKIDLMLAGHNHGGQVTLFGLYAPILPKSSRHPEKNMDTGQKYRYGWVNENSTDLYITSGVGVGSFPFRFFAPPEIVEITLQRIE